MSLAHLRLAEKDLLAAHSDVLEAAAGLSDSRRSRAEELAQLIADAHDLALRLATVVQGDLRAENAADGD